MCPDRRSFFFCRGLQQGTAFATVLGFLVHFLNWGLAKRTGWLQLVGLERSLAMALPRRGGARGAAHSDRGLGGAAEAAAGARSGRVLFGLGRVKVSLRTSWTLICAFLGRPFLVVSNFRLFWVRSSFLFVGLIACAWPTDLAGVVGTLQVKPRATLRACGLA